MGVRTGEHGDFGRLVIETLPGQPPVTIQESHDRQSAHLRFAEPVSIGLGGLQDRLKAIVRNIALDQDGQGLEITMREPGEIRPNAFKPGAIYLDLAKPQTTRPDSTPQPPAQSQAASASGQAPSEQKTTGPTPAAPVKRPIPSRLTVSRRGGIDRLTLSLPQSSSFLLDEKDGKARIALGLPLALNTARINKALPAALRPLQLQDDGSTVEFSLPPQRHVQLKRAGGKLLIDVLPPAAAPAEAKPAQARQAPATIPQETTPAAEAETPPAPSNPDAAAVHTKPANLSGVMGRQEDLQLIWNLAGQNLSLRFDWQEPVAAAIFHNGPSLWIVFDKQADLDLSHFSQQNLPIVTAMQTQEVSSGSGMAVKMTIWPGYHPAVRRAGNAWILELSTDRSQPAAPIEPTIRGQGAVTALDFPALAPSSPLSLVDPDTGELLVVVPLPQLGQGVAVAMQTPDFKTLDTIQGLAFKPVTDQLSIRAGRNSVEITAPDGLIVSPEEDRHKARPVPAETGKAIFSFESWVGNGKSAEATRQELQRQVARAPEQEKPDARIALARFFVANAMGAEATGVLGAAMHDTPQIFDDPNLRALRGAAAELMDNPDAAATDLDDKDLDKEGEIGLWRAAVAADRHDPKTVAANYALGGAFLPNYPPELRHRLELKIGEGLIDSGDTAEAQSLFTDVIDTNASRGQTDRAKFLLGRIAAAKGDSKKAVELWNDVSQSPLASLARAESNFALILANMDAGKMSRAEAIRALDRLRFAWRGDNFEIRLLRKLAALQIQDGDYRAGFDTLRRILANYPPGDATRGIAEEMQQAFTDIFLGKQAQSISPVTALALYDAFKELTPAGVQGDALIRSLVDRLVSIDLLDRAAVLLDQEIKTRLTGPDQSRATVQLALIRLLDQKPQAALDTLDMPSAANLTGELGEQAKLFRASALFQLGKSPDALTLIRDDQTPDAQRLKLDIAWSTHDWPSVSSLLLGELRKIPPGHMDDTIAGKVISAATAMALGNDRAGLAALRSTYGAAMQKTALQSDFSAIVDANVVGNASINPASLGTSRASVANAQSSQSFLDIYRQRVNTNGLSSVT